MMSQPGKQSKFGQVAPAITGVFVMLLVLALFNIQYFIGQFNYWVASASNSPATVMTADTATTLQKEKKEEEKIVRVAKDPKILIPKIQVDAPVVYGMDSVIESDVQRALQDGVLHFGGSPVPGENGNAVFVGHSSNVPWVPGDYKFVFTLLEKLEPGDTFNLNYDGIQYTYKITETKTVLPSDVSVLDPTDHPTVTLITCTPVGTSLKRFIVHADQVSPAPSSQNKAPVKTTAPAALPGS